MARLVSLLRRPRRSQPPADARRGERGATLTEYGLIVALVVVAAMGGILQLQDESGSYLVDTGSDIGTPRELAADMSPDLPEDPDWLVQPPPPTTTTTRPAVHHHDRGYHEHHRCHHQHQRRHHEHHGGHHDHHHGGHDQHHGRRVSGRRRDLPGPDGE